MAEADASGPTESPDALDKQLVDLPSPPQGARRLTMVVIVVSAIMAMGLASALWSEANYALSTDTAVDLGTLGAAELGELHENRYVRARVSVDVGRALHYRRPWESDELYLAPDKGAEGRIWVQYGVPAELQGPRFVPPALVAGRLVRVDRLGVRYRGLLEALRKSGVSAPERAWVLVDGNDPSSSRWVLGLALMLGIFAVWNATGLWRIVRKSG